MKKNHKLENLVNFLKADNAPTALIEWFMFAYKEWERKLNEKIPLSKCAPISPANIDHLSNINDQKLNRKGIKNLDKLAIIKLNGGLGTSMGCSTAKSLLKINPTETFIDIIVSQINSINKQFNSNLNLILMNSFYTDKETNKSILNKNITTFLQSRIPRVNVSNDDMANNENNINWCPPGHGNLYLSLNESGLLDQLISSGKEYVFISNSDNLGATINTTIYGYLMENQADFLMEVTPKTILDKKGGSLVRKDNNYYLLEQAQVDNSEIKEFESIDKFSLFNTNNIWIHLESLKKYLQNNQIQLPIIFNQKQVDSKKYVQFETAIGSAISCFQNAQVLSVPRNRFLPVKKTTDLFLLQSNLFKKNREGILEKKEQHIALPEVVFDEHNLIISEYTKHFKVIPNIENLNSLKIKGKIEFQENVSLSGDVILINQTDQTKVLKNIEISNQTITF